MHATFSGALMLLLVSAICAGCDSQQRPAIYDANLGGGFQNTDDLGRPIDAGRPVVNYDTGMPDEVDARPSDTSGRVMDAQVGDRGDTGPSGQADGAVCNADAGRAQLNGPFRCESPPESVVIQGESGRYRIFTYEASHPLATARKAFPCAREPGGGRGLQAPDEPTEACSLAGVRPWFSVRWAEAKRACEAIGWRLCSGAELTRACGGRDMRAFTYGAIFEAGACNLREAYVPEGSMFASEAPSGAFERCVSPDGVYDLTGNLWEWNADEGDEFSNATRFNQGAGWKTIAELHRDSDMHCDRAVTIPEGRADVHASSMVGFRCCQSME